MNECFSALERYTLNPCVETQVMLARQLGVACEEVSYVAGRAMILGAIHNSDAENVRLDACSKLVCDIYRQIKQPLPVARAVQKVAKEAEEIRRLTQILQGELGALQDYDALSRAATTADLLVQQTFTWTPLASKVLWIPLESSSKPSNPVYRWLDEGRAVGDALDAFVALKREVDARTQLTPLVDTLDGAT
jgi:hypothetical protein